MRSQALLSLLLLVAFSVFHSSEVAASWTTDGNALCTATGDQRRPMIVSDGGGGGIVAWYDNRSGNLDIYVQRVNASGIAQWTANGVALCTATGDQTYPTIVSDGNGGAIVAWHDLRSATNNDIYVQRVNASGIVQWTANGVALCTATGDQSNPTVVSDGAGGAIVTWHDGRSGNWDIYAQRVNASGIVQWTANGIALCTATGDQEYPTIISDGAGGAIVTWIDIRGASPDIYAQRLNASGIVQWMANGIALCTAANIQAYPTITSDASGGAIVTWHDSRSGNLDIYAQRVNASGAVQWTADGVALSTATGNQEYPTIDSDGAGGAIVTWHDTRNVNYDIYAQRVNASGAVQWSADGVALCTRTENQAYPTIASDGAGGAIVAWHDYHIGYLDIYVQRVNASGTVQWSADGVALCLAAGHQEYPQIVSDGAGGAIVTWEDFRGAYGDIYAHHIDSRGRIGYRPPIIHSVLDVPGDEGGYVNLAWNAPPFDYLSGEVTRYTVWRALETPAALALLERGAAFVTNPAQVAVDERDPILRLASFEGQTFYWKLISSLDAYRLPGYSEAAPTLFDSTAACNEYHYFQIIAHTADPAIYWISDPDSGYSVDNLAPDPPSGLMGEQKYVPAGLNLTWDRNNERDLAGYAVYRGETADFVPSEANRIAAPKDTLYFDDEWRWSDGHYYKVSAIDIHGNESGYALLGPEDVTGAETPKAPEVTYLEQNFPNPFNPATKIAFGLSAPAWVSLRVYDVSGRLVRTLVECERPAANYIEVWDGRDASGSVLASGLYFCRLDAGSFTQTRKMILLR